MCVLVVEDEWITLLAADMSLEAAGFDVVTAEHGPQAMERLVQNPGRFSCLVSDFHMPGGLTGAQIVERMRRAYPAIPMILTSAVAGVVTEQWRLHHKVDLLPKPYALDELVAAVTRLLGAPKQQVAPASNPGGRIRL